MKRTISLILLSLFVLPGLLIGPFAGGRREQTPPPRETQPRQEQGTRIEVPEEREPSTNLVIIDEPAWILFYHAGLESLQEEVSVTLDRGYVPTAMEIQPSGSIAILYTYDPAGTTNRWLLEDYTAETIDNDLSARIVSGWDPVAVSSQDGVFLVLFLQRSHGIRTWLLQETDVDSDQLVQTMDRYQRDNYALVDISIDRASERLWYFYVRDERRQTGPGAQFFVNAYPNGEATPEGITEDYTAARGFPTALASGAAISLVVFTTEFE